jgi:hypothetical protein
MGVSDPVSTTGGLSALEAVAKKKIIIANSTIGFIGF